MGPISIISITSIISGPQTIEIIEMGPISIISIISAPQTIEIIEIIEMGPIFNYFNYFGGPKQLK